MIFNSGWSKAEIESITYDELFTLAELFYKQHYEKMFDFFKMFCINNAESSAVAFSAEKGSLQKYATDVKKRRMVLADSNNDDFDKQFEAIN